MPFDASTPTSVAAYMCSDEGAAIARSVLAQSGDASQMVHGGGLTGAARLGPDALHARMVLAEIGNTPIEMACECVAEICRSGADLIVLGGQTDLATYRRLRDAGAREYFNFPVTAEDILAAQKAAPSPALTLVPQVEAPAPAKSPSIAIMGSNGGVGASLLAQNLAFFGSEAKGPDRRVALLDADVQFGTQAIDLDRDGTAGLFEALMSPARIDETFITATMDHITPRLSLYSNQIGAGQDAASFEPGLGRLIAPLCTSFDVVLTDLPRGQLLGRPELADAIDTLVLLIPAGFSGVNAASRLINRVQTQNPDLRIVPVLSDLRRDAGLSAKDIKTIIGMDVAATLPRCDTAMTRAHRAAKPVVQHQPRGAYAKVVGQIWQAAITTPDPETATSKPLLRRLFG